MWYKFQQILTKNYSDFSHVSDAMLSYMKITQGEVEPVAQYIEEKHT